MGDAIKSGAAVSQLIPLLLILDSFFVSLHRPPISSAALFALQFQVFGSNWSASRRWCRRAAFVMSGESLLSSQYVFCLLPPLWLSGTCESSAPSGLWHPLCLWPQAYSGVPRVWGVWVKCYNGGWGKHIESLWMTCHIMFHEQAGWLNHWVCGTYGATGHSEINTLWIIPTAWQEARWCTGGVDQLYALTLLSLHNLTVVKKLKTGIWN